MSSRASHLAAERFDQAQQLLARQAAAVRDRDRDAYLATIDPQEATFAKVAARTFDNLVRMGVTDYRFGSLVEDLGGLTPERREVLGPTAWVADVGVTFRLEGPDPELWKTDLRTVFVERQGVTYLAADGEGTDSGAATPLWLSDTVGVVRSKHTMVIGAGPQSRLERYARTAERSVSRVSRVWGDDWPEYVVVIVPATQAQMERMVGVEPDSQNAVAAVTTSVGRVDPSKASHIVLNPEPFDKIGSLGRIVVLTHETTHVAAHATVSTMPVWLSEGFADYVGFHESGLSTAVIAQEFLAEVRRSGGPEELPGGPDFDPQAKALDQAYESAWSACKYIAYRWGTDTLVEFYRVMDGAKSEAEQDEAYETVLNTTREDFVARWRRYVEVKSRGG